MPTFNGHTLRPFDYTRSALDIPPPEAPHHGAPHHEHLKVIAGRLFTYEHIHLPGEHK